MVGITTERMGAITITMVAVLVTVTVLARIVPQSRKRKSGISLGDGLLLRDWRDGFGWQRKNEFFGTFSGHKTLVFPFSSKNITRT
jgi:hypothetical protein